VEVDPRLVVPASAYVESEGARCCRELLADGVDVTAVLAGNDLMAIGCIDALREVGLDCPGDVSVVGVNDMAWCDRFSPPLTTVRVPLYALGSAEADLLLERLKEPDANPPRSVVLPTELIVRGSTGDPATQSARRRLAGRPLPGEPPVRTANVCSASAAILCRQRGGEVVQSWCGRVKARRFVPQKR